MMLKTKQLECPIELVNDKLNCLLFGDIKTLFDFSNDFNNAIENDEDTISIFDKDTKLKLEQNVDYVTDLLNLTLNKRKLITHLHNKILHETANTSQIFSFNKVKENIIEWIKNIKKETLISFDLNEDFESSDVLKLLKVQFKEKGDTLFERLLNYIEVISEMGKHKLLVINSLLFYLDEKEVYEIFNLCQERKLTLLCIEFRKIYQNIENVNIINIVDGFVLKPEFAS